MIDILLDALFDSLKLIPFLFITYWLMELLEYKAGEKSERVIEKAGRFGPMWGGILGAFPQCGFSAAASSLYAGRIITMGTLISIYLATSDEMLPIFISESVEISLIIKILAAKVLIGMISGFMVEVFFTMFLKKKHEAMDIHTFCEQEHCKCEDNVLVSACKHTLKIAIYIFLFTLILNFIISWVGEDKVSLLFTNVPVVGQLIAGLVGLIPNCAASVIITELYLEGIIGIGSMMSGLLVGAGVGLLILFRVNRRHIKENLTILGILYAFGVVWGVIIEAFSGLFV